MFMIGNADYFLFYCRKFVFVAATIKFHLFLFKTLTNYKDITEFARFRRNCFASRAVKNFIFLFLR